MKFVATFLPGLYVIAKISRIAPIADALIRHILNERNSVLMLTIAPEEISMVVSTEWWSQFDIAGVWRNHADWKIITIDAEQTLECSGVLERITEKFSHAGVAISCTSTYNLNYIMFSADDELKVISMMQYDPDWSLTN